MFLSMLGKHVYFTLYLVEQQYLVDVDLVQSVIFEKTFLVERAKIVLVSTKKL